MRYRLNLLSTQSAQPLLRSDNLGSSQLLVSRKDIQSVLHYLAWDTTVSLESDNHSFIIRQSFINNLYQRFVRWFHKLLKIFM